MIERTLGWYGKDAKVDQNFGSNWMGGKIHTSFKRQKADMLEREK